MKRILLIFCACLLAMQGRAQESAQERASQITILSTDTIVDGSMTVIVRKYSNGVESKAIMGGTEQQREALGIKPDRSLKAGAQVPDFEFTNLAGQRVKMSSLQGKYTYIDVWATWCGPCKAEIPYLEKLQQQLEGRMNFVSVSVDKTREPWEPMARELHGMQLWNGESGEFMERFGIRGIPRFILVDPEGKIVAPSAIRPSNPDAAEILTGIIDGTYTAEQSATYSVRGLPPKDVTGQPSFAFAYPDRNGKTVRLEDLRGKIVLIDVWATWCAPCMQEIPALKKLEEEYAGRDIAFVSISVDADREAWLKMLEVKGMGGVQLYSGDPLDDFMKSYRVNGIPHFIMLDRQGRIVDANMKIRPSNPAIKALLDGLLKR